MFCIMLCQIALSSEEIMYILENSDFESENDVSDSPNYFVSKTSEDKLSPVGDVSTNFSQPPQQI